MLVTQPNSDQPILLWHEGALGDLLLSRLAIAAIRTLFPQKLILCARNEARRLFLEAALIDEVYPTHPDLLLDNFGLVFLFASSPILIELFKERFSEKLICLPTRPQRESHLALEQFFTLAKALDLRDKTTLFQAALKKGKILKKEDQGEYLLLHPGSGGRWKCTSLPFMIALFEHLKTQGFKVRFILGPAEEELHQALRGYELIFCVGLEQALKALSQAMGFLGHDSGLTHLAAALGRPTLTLFGPTTWYHWSPYGTRVLIIHSPCSCREKGLDPRQCQERCLTRLDPKEISIYAQRFFSTTATSAHRSGEPFGMLAEIELAEEIPLGPNSEWWLRCFGLEVVEVAEG